MVSWQDEAIILAISRFSESSLRLEVLSAEHGRYAGIVKGGASAKRIALFDTGNIIQARWSARLSEQLGSFTTELLAQPAATILHDNRALTALNSAAALILQCVPERHAEPALYAFMLQFLKHLQSSAETYMRDYISLELGLLEAVGFPLDLSQCAATKQTSGLTYVSPKSGRAVSAAAGAPYHDRLLKLPAFLLDMQQEHISDGELLKALTLTGYFLNHHAEEITHKPLPEARTRLLQLLQRTS